ncbi:MAG: efflux RND transporter periplasmic adaptor subunit [Sphingobium sp.]
MGDSLDTEEGQLKRRRRLILIAAALIAAIIIVAVVLFRSGEEENGAIGAGDLAPHVTVVRPGTSAVSNVVNATGTIGARREMPVGVVGEGGAVSAVLVEPGNWVKAGQVLARVERSVQTQQRASLEAALKVARADASLAQNDLDRAQALVSRGFVSKADLDRKTAARDAANARVAVAQAQLQEQQARIGRLDIRSPAAGLVLTRNVEPGQVVGAGSGVLFRLAKGGEMEVLAKVGETDLAHISVGIPAQVTPVGGNQTYTGQVWQVSPVIDPQSRQGIARIALSYHPDLRPGGFASARIVSSSAESPVLPESAIQNDAKGSYVFVVNDKNVVERRDVTVGQVSAAGVAIKSGLSGNERIVALAGGFLNVGQKVVPELEKAAGSGGGNG